MNRLDILKLSGGATLLPLTTSIASASLISATKSGPSLKMSLSSYDNATERLVATKYDTVLLNTANAFTQFNGANAAHSIYGTLAPHRASHLVAGIPFDVTANGTRVNGTAYKQCSSNMLEAKVTVSGTTVEYTIDPSTKTAQGSAIAGTRKVNLHSQGRFNSQGEATGYDATVTGSFNGGFSTTFATPIPKNFTSISAYNAQPMTASGDAWGFFGSAFDAAGIFLDWGLGLTWWGRGAAIIGVGLGLWGQFGGGEGDIEM